LHEDCFLLHLVSLTIHQTYCYFVTWFELLKALLNKVQKSISGPWSMIWYL